MDPTSTAQHLNLTTLPYDVRQMIFRTLVSSCILTINAPWHLLLLRFAFKAMNTRAQLDGIRLASAVSSALLTSHQPYSEITSLLSIYKTVTLYHTRGTYDSFLSIPCTYLQNVKEFVLNMQTPYVHFDGEHRVLDLVKKVPKLTKLQFEDAVNYSNFKDKTKAYIETQEAKDEMIMVAKSSLEGKHFGWILGMIKDGDSARFLPYAQRRSHWRSGEDALGRGTLKYIEIDLGSMHVVAKEWVEPDNVGEETSS